METIDIKDALILEEHEQLVVRHRRTRHAIHDTYGPKQPTKFRRKLPGKRKWKNKTAQYAVLEGQMTKDQFNSTQKFNKTIHKLMKREAKRRRKHSLTD